MVSSIKKLGPAPKERERWDGVTESAGVMVEILGAGGRRGGDLSSHLSMAIILLPAKLCTDSSKHPPLSHHPHRLPMSPSLKAP